MFGIIKHKLKQNIKAQIWEWIMYNFKWNSGKDMEKLKH